MSQSLCHVVRPSIKYLRECLRYENGQVFWLNRPRSHFESDRIFQSWNTKWANKEASSIFPTSGGKQRRQIRLKGKTIERSHVVWAICHGRWPDTDKVIDHIDRNSMNDRIENLRLVTQSQNAFNSSLKKTNKFGHRGIAYESRTNKYTAQIGMLGKHIHLGTFDTIEEAIAARRSAARKYHGEDIGATGDDPN